MSDYLFKLLHLNLTLILPRREKGLKVSGQQFLHRPTALSQGSSRTKPLPNAMTGLKEPWRFEGSFDYGFGI